MEAENLIDFLPKDMRALSCLTWRPTKPFVSNFVFTFLTSFFSASMCESEFGGSQKLHLHTGVCMLRMMNQIQEWSTYNHMHSYNATCQTTGICLGIHCWQCWIQILLVWNFCSCSFHLLSIFLDVAQKHFPMYTRRGRKFALMEISHVLRIHSI